MNIIIYKNLVKSTGEHVVPIYQVQTMQSPTALGVNETHNLYTLKLPELKNSLIMLSIRQHFPSHN
jgi:hypothetical protein